MTIESVLQSLTTALIPCLPYLVKFGTKASEEVAKGIGADTWSLAKRLWSALAEKADKNAATKEVIEEVVKSPSDTDAQVALRFHLKKLLEADSTLVKELTTILDESPATVNAVGNRAVAVGNSVSGSTIVTGDNATLHRERDLNRS